MSDKTIRTKLHCYNCQWSWLTDVENPDYICPDCGINSILMNKFRKQDSIEWCQQRISKLEAENKRLKDLNEFNGAVMSDVF